ncbi:hypothetical protein MACH24_04870 [Erythrobacter sp. Dej080120_24]|uniref:hypothetical protein n=1 Tax=Erythrobacter sp. Dej080120_24 TaxID=3024837 RepID=UPI0029263A6D|nr:hypothetical protein MACH24_04870 [Erythrobacter sp. Dej080120_24]
MTSNLGDNESEEDGIRAFVRRNTRVRLMAAGLLSPKRKRTEESFALEMRIRHEAQAQEDWALIRLREKQK